MNILRKNLIYFTTATKRLLTMFLLLLWYSASIYGLYVNDAISGLCS